MQMHVCALKGNSAVQEPQQRRPPLHLPRRLLPHPPQARGAHWQAPLHLLGQPLPLAEVRLTLRALPQIEWLHKHVMHSTGLRTIVAWPPVGLFGAYSRHTRSVVKPCNVTTSV